MSGMCLSFSTTYYLEFLRNSTIEPLLVHGTTEPCTPTELIYARNHAIALRRPPATQPQSEGLHRVESHTGGQSCTEPQRMSVHGQCLGIATRRPCTVRRARRLEMGTISAEKHVGVQDR